MQTASNKLHRFGRCAGLCLLCLLLGTAAGCATLSRNKNTQEKLAKAAEDFNNALRWGDFSQAANWIPPARQEQFWDQCDRMHKKIRVTSFEIRHIRWQPADTSQIIVYYSYYYTDDPSVRNKTVQQRWRFLPKLEKWEVTQTSLAQLLPQ